MQNSCAPVNRCCKWEVIQFCPCAHAHEPKWLKWRVLSRGCLTLTTSFLKPVLSCCNRSFTIIHISYICTESFESPCRRYETCLGYRYTSALSVCGSLGAEIADVSVCTEMKSHRFIKPITALFMTDRNGKPLLAGDSCAWHLCVSLCQCNERVSALQGSCVQITAPEDRPALLIGFSWFFSVKQMTGQWFKLGDARFLPYRFQFIIH